MTQARDYVAHTAHIALPVHSSFFRPSFDLWHRRLGLWRLLAALALFFLLGSVSGTLWAEHDTEARHRTFIGGGVKGSIYVGVGAGKSTFRRNKDDEQVQQAGLGGIGDTKGRSIKLYLGYHIDHVWAVEASYIDWGELNFKYTTGQTYEAPFKTYALSLKYRTLVFDEYYLFVKAGVQRSSRLDLFYNDSRVYNTKNDMIFGWGLDYPINQSLNLRMEYEQIGPQDNNNRLVSGSFNYNF